MRVCYAAEQGLALWPGLVPCLHGQVSHAVSRYLWGGGSVGQHADLQPVPLWSISIRGFGGSAARPSLRYLQEESRTD